ncbi:MAG: hypothetical protein UZ12_BCD005001106 [Bacteroidetes bacterium OLB12]|nr:MAG: hypothetical protein UZ12_BCD005001106 [Bacteroidetes bacterium OLB12]HNR73431.1 hypothetical protein [Cyclobacteriaceae bacterium]
MKRIIWAVWIGLIVMGCQDGENTSEFTGNEITYALQQSSEYEVSGTVKFKERRDGTTTVVISLTGTDGNEKLPVHLHLGDMSEADADVAALLSPVDSKTGKSETILIQLADETTVAYANLLQLEACIKIHLADTGPGRDVILAAGNIGEAFTKSITNGRTGIGVCKSE